MHPGDFWTYYNEVNMIEAKSSFLEKFSVLFLALMLFFFHPQTRKQQLENSIVNRLEHMSRVSLSHYLLYFYLDHRASSRLKTVQSYSSVVSLPTSSYLFCVFVCFRFLSCKFLTCVFYFVEHFWCFILFSRMSETCMLLLLLLLLLLLFRCCSFFACFPFCVESFPEQLFSGAHVSKFTWQHSAILKY